jgi:hypothetical protein
VSLRDLSSEVFVDVGLLYKDNVDMVGVCLGEGNSVGFWVAANIQLEYRDAFFPWWGV